MQLEKSEEELEFDFRNRAYTAAENLPVAKKSENLEICRNCFSGIGFKVSYHLNARVVKIEPNCNLLNILVSKIFDSLKWFKTKKVKLYSFV